MSETNNTSSNAVSTQETSSKWQASHVYLMAMACLVLGVAIGYLLRGSQSASPAPEAAQTVSQQSAAPSPAPNQPPTLEKMKQMADKAAEPVMERLQKNPKDFDALNDAGKIYRTTHQFAEAAEYYRKALEINPKSAAARTDLASCLYYTGDADGALAELNKALSYDPNFFGALLNVGIIKVQAKNDFPGAINSWNRILKTNANAEQKQMVKMLIDKAKEQDRKPDVGSPKS